ncbi:MAG: hypothetical protein WBP61_16650, partial [Nocardioides sp.]
MRARLLTAATAALASTALVAGVAPAVAAAGQAGNDKGGNPGGNNGTVKIADIDADESTSNDPHVECSFRIRWFNFDKGDEINSYVSFTPQAPTKDITILPGHDFVWVGGDDAGGGNDLDGDKAYTLAFSGGEPHPVQGYHVKVSVATPGSKGNDTKSKVIWIKPCAAPDPTPEPTPDPTPEPTPDPTPEPTPDPTP